MNDTVFDLAFGDGNPRNSEGAFLRTASGRIRSRSQSSKRSTIPPPFARAESQARK